MPYLFLYLTLAFTLMVTIFHHQNLKKYFDDLKAILIYFLCFFFFFLVVPLVLAYIFEPEYSLFLKGIGFSFGKIKIGLILIAVSIPVSIFAGYSGSRDSKLGDYYPLSKTACKTMRSFIYYEIAYFFLYYFPWEFVYRGLLFFTLLQCFDLFIALSIQTIISTLHHIGHPQKEIFAALLAGFSFGLVAYFTQSFFYTFLIHGFIGISTDTFLYRSHYQSKG